MRHLMRKAQPRSHNLGKLLLGVEIEEPGSHQKLGGRTRARTWDPLIKSQLLYQLSYASIPLGKTAI